MLLTSSAPPTFLSAYIDHRYRVHTWASLKNSLPNPRFSFVRYRFSRGIVDNNTCKTSRNKLQSSLKFTATSTMGPNNQTFSDGPDDWEDLEDVDSKNVVESPWEGAIVYKRNPSISHVEYCTTLERLGLGKHSTEISKSKASAMGIRVTNAVKDYPFGTPVQISVDVTRKKKKLRLDGIIKSVLTLGCNRCGEPAAESIFSNFSLLLTEEPVEEPEVIDMGAMFSKDKFKSATANTDEGEDEDEASIDWDDRLHFPPEEREIDISKNIRDLVHVEITINAICDAGCKGLCLKCGTNLNTGTCNCGEERAGEEGYGNPLKNLRKQMQEKC